MEIFFIETSIVASKGRRNSESFQKSAKTETPHEISIKTKTACKTINVIQRLELGKFAKNSFKQPIL